LLKVPNWSMKIDWIGWQKEEVLEITVYNNNSTNKYIFNVARLLWVKELGTYNLAAAAAYQTSIKTCF